jgi:hypothetical protein
VGLVAAAGLLWLSIAVYLERAAAPGTVSDPLAPESRELTLATEHAFYLLLETEALRLHIMYEGVSLHAYPVMEMETGRSRLALGGPELAARWDERVYGGGRLSPERYFERLRITPPEPGDSLETAILPPSIEERVKVPHSFRIEYPGLVVHVDRSGAEGPLAEMTHRLREAVSIVGGGFRTGRTSLRLRLDPESAEHLYRSLPPSSGFGIVPRRSTGRRRSRARQISCLRMQAAKCPASPSAETRSSGGTSRLQASITNGHLGWKAQPGGGFTALGVSPRMGASFFRFRGSASGTDAISARV